MMKKDQKHIEKLIDNFFEGVTSNEDELQLYQYFKQKDIPENLVQYKPIIHYFESGLANECEYQAPTQVIRPSLKKRWIIWSGIAASFLVILFSTLLTLKSTKPFNPYEGSYIVKNGVYITDMDLIKPELETVVQKVLLYHQECEQKASKLMENENRDLQIKQQILDQHNKILDNFSDKNIKKEVQEILNINF